MENRLLYALALLATDLTFLKEHASEVEPEDFPEGATRRLAVLALQTYRQYHVPLTPVSLDAALKGSEEDEADELRELFRACRELVHDEDALPVLREQAERWLKERYIGRAIDEAKTALLRGDRDAALQAITKAERVTTQPHQPLDVRETLTQVAQAGEPPAPIPTGVPPLDSALEGGMRPGELGVVLGPTNSGKALAVDTPVATPQGWKMMGELRPGDQVFDERGRPCTVLFVSPVWKKRPAYAVSFSSGETIVADEAHEWLVHSLNWKSPRIVETRELYQMKQRGERLYVESHAPLQLPEAQLPLDPYILGVWLGDGTAREGQVTTPDEEIVDALEEAGFSPRRLSPPYRVGTRGLKRILSELGLIQNKHIPQTYLRASMEQRLALLQGLMDSDGYISSKGNCELSLSRERLAHEAAELITSLGMKCRVRKRPAKLYGRQTGYCYRIAFSPTLPVFRLPRKADRMNVTERGNKRRTRNHIRDVQPVAPTDTVCITVDSPSHLFLAGRHMIPTHNSMVAAVLAASAFLAGKRVIYYTSELTVRQVTERVVAAIFKVPIKEVQQRAEEFASYLDDITEALPEAEVRVVEMHDRPTVRQVKADLVAAEREGKPPHVVVIDSADDLRSGRQMPSLYLELAEVYTDLRNRVAQGKKLVVWTTSQTNRQAIDKARVSLKHIGDSFAKAQRAHVVVGISQTEQELRAPFAPRMRLVLLKDTLHGRRGEEWYLTAKFGREGTPGYPGFEEEQHGQ